MSPDDPTDPTSGAASERDDPVLGAASLPDDPVLGAASLPDDPTPGAASEPDDPTLGAASLLGGPGEQVRADARAAIEAIVLVGEQPIDPNLLGQLLELSPAVVDELCEALADEYEAEGRGFQLARVAGGWRYQSHPAQAAYVERFVLAGQTAKLSAAALETLAIVAYKQPISRAQVGAIRGVNVDGVMRTLVQRGYIAEVGRDPGPGQAAMFGTTPDFLATLGLDHLGQLPALGDFVPGADVVEQLERGLRPEPSLPERLTALEDANADRDTDSKAPNGTALDLDAMLDDGDDDLDAMLDDGDDDLDAMLDDGDDDLDAMLGDADGDRDPFGE